ALKEKGNVLWMAPFGGRSAPLVMDGRIYVLQGFGEGLAESERVVCLEEKTGKKLWEYVERIYHCDIVSSRLGWTPLTGDPATGHVYAHTTAGNLVCLDKTGKLIWERQLSEEFGRVSGYGGRIVAPTFDSGLVIVGMLNSSWGDQARGANRFIAFDAKNGQVVWITETGFPLKVTYQSNPMIAVINGQRLLITGGSDGGLHAFKVRTGEKVWSYIFSAGAVNPSPVVDGNFVYCTHGEENPGGGAIGRVSCVDASQIDAAKKPKVVWEYRTGARFGLSSPAIADGVLYMPDDSGDLFAFDAKSGKVLWKYRYATEVRGAPLVADGKIYIFDVKGKLIILKLDGKKKPDDLDTFEYRFRENIEGKVVQTETNGTPIAVNGRVYFTSRTDLYCIGDPKAKPVEVKYKPMPAETPFKEFAIAGARLSPAEVTVTDPAKPVKFTVVLFDANGREVKSNLPDPKAEWSILTPAKTPTGAQPPRLDGTIEGNTAEGTLKLGKNPSQQGYVEFKMGGITARARVRVAPQIPFSQNFDKAPEGSSPGGWVNTNGKFVVKKVGDSNVLSKVNNNARPPLAKANGYVTLPSASNYTIQADIRGELVRDKLPDAGLINSRYTLVLDGKPDPELKNQRTLRITSWEARPRINVVVAFDWQPGTWYTAKFVVEQTEKTAIIRGKVWKKGNAEPANWTISFEDPHPNRDGAAGLYGYISNVLENDQGMILPGSELYFDNLSITPNAKK
ncbi:MAG: PQQ-like beta-propeller repeat protein, partial [Planctomycetia bacterium]|nr:PQQ-like beta-propeller repeat protein [Planctomycetia bacterium]